MNKKKIGILTTYFASNFGAALQPFALKRTLEQKGYNVEMIRYKQNNVYNNYKPIKVSRLFLLTHPIYTYQYIKNTPIGILLRKDWNFKRFVYKHINPKPGFCKTIPQNKQFYFIGSDQIWNPSITGGFDEIYWGNFDTRKDAIKIAYAASAEGINYTKSEVDYIIKHLSNFKYVSVREKTLAENLIKISGNNNINVVLDPTLLANPKIYDEIGQINPLPDKRYILFYKIRESWLFIDKIYDYASSLGVHLLILSSWYEHDIVSFTKSHKNVIYIPTAGVEIFLGAIRNAECVFTPSFHGCVFPIIFHKPFFSLVLNDTWNTRAHDLLCALNLTERLLNINDSIPINDINYVEVENRLQLLRHHSLSFIDNALNY